jgi:hypothetical protein
MPSHVMFVALVSAVLLFPPRFGARSQAPDPPLRITAFGVNLSNLGPYGAHEIEFHIDRWSTDAERAQLVAALTDKGTDGLLAALQALKPVGVMRLPSSVAYDVQYARKRPHDSSHEQIIIATDRRIGAFEARDNAKALNYPFTLIEVRVDARGHGEGKLSLASKIVLNKDKQTPELENYAKEPVSLQNIRVMKK